MDSVAAAGVHRHETQRLLILTEQHNMHTLLLWKRCKCYQSLQYILQEGQLAIWKNAYAHGRQTSLYVMHTDRG